MIFHLHIPSIPCYAPAFIVRIGVWFLLRYRKKRYGTEFRRIKLSCGRKGAKKQYTIVDPQDYQKLSQYDWQYYEESNGRRAIRLSGRQIFSMHREIMNAPAGFVIDHRDRNGLNNTKKNLRIATISQNNTNRGKTSKPTSSKYKGVCLIKTTGKWRAVIKHNRIYRHLGHFHNEEDAAKAYDKAAKKYHGEFAVLNFEQETADMPKYPIP